jgi:cyclophilin family peptidyl-prolyl cis-trans isomerase
MTIGMIWRHCLTAASLAALVAASLAALVAAPAAAQPAAAKPASRPEPAAVKAEFDTARAAWDKILGEIAVLEAKYRQPGADKQAVAADYEKKVAEVRAAADRLEQAALAVVTVEPKNPQAREICGAVVASAIQNDDPDRGLAVATKLAESGAADDGISFMAATAAMILSRPDDAAAWLAKAKAAGLAADQAADLERALAQERPKITAELAKRQAEAAADDLPRVKLTTSAGDMLVELFENEAPNAVANFIALVEKGFYDGTPFHRVIGGFMAQGGDPTGTGTGGPGHAIACECDKPGARQHFLGSLSMAHAGKNTGGSQFFLTFRPTEHLDGKHTVFGRVIEGLDVLPRIRRTQDDEGRSVAGVEPDRITKAVVVRKRNHPYEPVTLPDPRR